MIWKWEYFVIAILWVLGWATSVAVCVYHNDRDADMDEMFSMFFTWPMIAILALQAILFVGDDD